MFIRSVGIRVHTKKVWIAYIVKEDKIEVNSDNLIVPKALLLPDTLRFIRTSLQDIIEEFDASRVGVKVADHNSYGNTEGDIFRLNVEGVIQELLASSNITGYIAGAKPELASRLGTDSTHLKEVIKRGNLLEVAPAVSKQPNKYKRAAAAAGVASLFID